MDGEVSGSSKITHGARENSLMSENNRNSIPPSHRKSLLVLGGGGVRAASEISAYLELKSAGLFESLPYEIRGTSGGFIVGIPIALGASDERLLEIARTIPYKEFDDTSFGFARDGWRFLKHFGARKGEKVAEWIRELIRELIGVPDLTFGGLAKLRVKRTPCKLSCLSVDIDTGRVVLSSAQTTPDRKIWEAARRSLSIPFYFQALRVKPQFPNLEVDGGVLNNYDVTGFDSVTLGGKRVPNSKVIGIRVGDREETDRGLGGMFEAEGPCRGIVGFSERCFQLIYSQAQNSHLEPEDWNRTVWVDGLGIPATKFGISSEEVERLLESGRRGARKWLEWYKGEIEKED